MPNDSTAFIQTDFQHIFQKQDPWYEEMMEHYQQIQPSKKLLDQSKTEEEYKTRWNTWNQNYHWWLIRMDQYLCQYNTKHHNMVHEIVMNCFQIAQQTGYWNNKYSKTLYNWFQKAIGEATT